jgi:hypothetical protein
MGNSTTAISADSVDEPIGGGGCVGDTDRSAVADDVAPTGNLVPDAHVVAVMLANGRCAVYGPTLSAESTTNRDRLLWIPSNALDPDEGGRPPPTACGESLIGQADRC